MASPDQTNSLSSNVKRAIVAVLAPLPSILFYVAFLNSQSSADSSKPLWRWCYNHPLLLANAFFFFNVNVLFWVVGLLQASHWMIDLYWTVIPVLLTHYFHAHPLAEFNAWRSKLVMIMTWVWAVRLTHSYFRREKWQWGAREDWRFSDLSRQYGKSWWWVSFFAIYVSQQVFLMGICLPLYVIHSKATPLNIWDSIATLICLIGITMAYFADTQLHEFVTKNERLKKLGQKPASTLESGLWHYSRHPYYFGEQLWWWGLATFAWNLGNGWTFLGPLVNSCVLAYVTVLVEERMLKAEHRAEAYKAYQKRTSVWIPWFSKSLEDEAKKET